MMNCCFLTSSVSFFLTFPQNTQTLVAEQPWCDTSGDDYTDLDHLRPADWNVNSARNNLYFGICTEEDGCTVPAHPQAAPDTAKNSVFFTPPAIVRGDIARASFYMDVRYSAANNDGDDLILTDCPNEEAKKMKFQSVLVPVAHRRPSFRCRAKTERKSLHDVAGQSQSLC
jgi:Endonuclease I